VALDGKTLRGSRKQGAPGVHLLSALSHHVGLTLAQQAVSDKTNEITQVEAVLRQLVLPGRVFTMDALLTQRHVAQAIVDGGGDYVMIVKANQPQLHADIEFVSDFSVVLFRPDFMLASAKYPMKAHKNQQLLAMPCSPDSLMEP
jgi:hypothetical protein